MPESQARVTAPRIDTTTPEIVHVEHPNEVESGGDLAETYELQKDEATTQREPKRKTVLERNQRNQGYSKTNQDS